MKKITTTEFIERAKKIHGDKYDYSKTEYTHSKEKVCIICPEHGEFWIRASHHLGGIGCHKCAKEKSDEERRLGKEVFVERSRKIHDNVYDYSKVCYINNREKVCIICPEHGEFWQKPSDHMNGSTCPICANMRISASKIKDTAFFIKQAKMLHGERYDYKLSDYRGCEEKLAIICPEHGVFYQTPIGHISNKEGCPICGRENMTKKRRHTKEFFIEKSNKVHNNVYDYSKTDYKNNYTKVVITCKKHGDFMQTPHNHLMGAGCPKCNGSKMERKTMIFFNENNIEYEYQKHFKNWLGCLSLDFYLPKYNVGIECQGIQHFEPIRIRGESWDQAKENFKKQVDRDKLKKDLCESHGVKIYYVMHNDNLEEKIKAIINDCEKEFQEHFVNVVEK